jgi:acyl-CoA synthetase (AMP-forming)/AMP-acid ligase II
LRSEWRDLDGLEQARRLGRAGTPALGVRIKVNDEGEVLAQTNHALEGYWNNPAETARVQKDGWFHTGDGGSFVDGYLTISDRKKDVIITGGENVSSIEVEDALSLHPAIRDVAVIGIPDEKWGELVTAIVVTDGSEVSAEDLMQYCRGHLAGFKIPRKFEFRVELPRTATGKVQKFVLREPFWRDKDRAVN